MKNPTLDAFFPRGIRNFNPGNIENGPFAKSQPGYVGSDGRFAQFDTMDNGINAHSALLGSYGNKGLNTLNAIINKWAPSSDGNNTNAYASFVGKKIGVDPNQPLDMNDPNVRRNIAMAMGRYENGMSPVDPRSWQASATPQPATGAPMQLPGATAAPQEQSQQGAQSISLGDQENTQPFNNLGSTLANMGASIASLDRHGTGIASLNASHVANNLAMQEAAREKEGGWKYAGQTQNGQGMIFQNSKGEIRVEPLSGKFGGAEKTTLEKNLELADGDTPQAEMARQALGITNTPKLDNADFNRILDKEIAGGKIGPTEFGTGKLSNENRIGYQKFKTENLKPFGISESDLAQAASNQQYRGRIARDLGGTEGRFTLAYNNFMGGAKVLEDYSKNYPREWPQIVEAARQGSIKQLNIPGIGAKELGQLDTAFDTTAIEYAKAKNPGNTQLALSEQNEAKNKFKSTMSHEELMGRIDAMKSELNANKDRMLKLHSNIIGNHIKSPLESATDDTSLSSPQEAPKQQDTSSSEKALPMPSNITNPQDFMSYAKANKIPVGTPFKMGDKTIYVQPY